MISGRGAMVESGEIAGFNASHLSLAGMLPRRKAMTEKGGRIPLSGQPLLWQETRQHGYADQWGGDHPGIV
jgi:hypothetical protein